MTACTHRVQPYYEYLSVEQLKEIGFYAYVLPEQIEDKLGWQRQIRMMYPLERTYCRTDSDDDGIVEPVTVLYTTDDDFILHIYISPNVLFGRGWQNQETSSIALDSEFTLNNQGEYQYMAMGELWLKFKDFKKMDVVVIAEMETECANINCLVELINQLEFVGPPPNYLGNPWEDICEG